MANRTQVELFPETLKALQETQTKYGVRVSLTAIANKAITDGLELHDYMVKHPRAFRKVKR